MDFATRDQVRRSRILGQLHSGQPALIALIAPAGYGKSTVARQFAENWQTTYLCDCNQANGPIDLAGRVLTTLAASDASRLATIAELKLSQSTDTDTWADLCRSQWCEERGVSLFVFENLEHIVKQPDCVALIAGLFGRRTASRTIVVCSRVQLPLRLTRYALPHETITLRPAELRFDGAELHHLFKGAGVASEDIERLAAVSAGWPIAALLLRRIARQRQLSTVLDALDEVALADLHEYLSDQVLAGLETDDFEAMLSLVTIPDASVDDVVNATGRSGERNLLRERLQQLPFVIQVSDSTYAVHPLVQAILSSRFAQACERLARNSAACWQRMGNSVRAGEIYMAIGDIDAAAQAIEEASVLFFDTPSVGYANIVQALDQQTLIRHPAVWAAATPCRVPGISREQWLDEASVVWNSLDATTPSDVRAAVLGSYAKILSNLGRHAEAMRLLDDFVRSRPDGLGEAERFLHLMLRLAILSRQCRFDEVNVIWTQLEPLFRSKCSLALCLNEGVARQARIRGNRALERGVLDRAIAVAAESKVGMPVCYVLMDAAFGAWLAGEDLLFEYYVRELNERHASRMRHSVELFLTCACGPLEAVQDSFENPNYRCYAYLIASARSSGADRKAFLYRAASAADLCGQPFLQTLTRVALAEVEPLKRACFLADASRFARMGDIAAPGIAVACIRRGRPDEGTFGAFVARYRSAAVAVTAELRISVLRCTVAMGDDEIKLTNRERELLTALALHPRGVPRLDLSEWLWPDGDDKRRDTVLRVYVNRLRAKLGDAKWIQSTADGYRLLDSAAVDVREIEHRARRLRRESVVDKAFAATLASDLDVLTGPGRAAALRWSWFAAGSRSVDELALEIGYRLAQDALGRDEPESALSFARRLLEMDPCDESACELAMRAHLKRKDKAGAAIELRRHREALKRELDLPPSPMLEELAR